MVICSGGVEVVGTEELRDVSSQGPERQSTEINYKE